MLNPSIDSLLQKSILSTLLVTVAAKRAREMQLANNCVVENLFLINV